MSTSNTPAHNELRALLIDAPVGRHFAQLHHQASSLAKSVGLYVEAGLRRGNGVVVIATPEHVALLLGHLASAGIDRDSAREAGQLALLDAEEMLDGFMRGGMPDWSLFRRLMGEVLDGILRSGRNTTRAYGEMVNILWRQGRPQAAICLEEYWNELARLYPFSLFCCYTMDMHDHSVYHDPLHEIGRTHSDIVPTEDDDRLQDALEAAAKDVFGTSLSELIPVSGMGSAGEERLPPARRTMLWIMKNFPRRSATVLDLALQYYAKQDGKVA